MKRYELRNTNTHESLFIEAFGWELSKGERMFLFFCVEGDKIAEKAFNTYNWYIWKTEII